MSFAARVDARGWAQLLLWVVPLLWSSNYVIARAADGVIAPHALAAGRWLVAGALLLAFVWRPLREHRDAILIYAVTPMTIATASAWALREAISRWQWLGMGLALAGLLFIISKGDPMRLLAVQFVAGDLWITACAVSWTAYSVLLKRWPSALPPLVRLVAVIGGGLVVLLPGALLEALLVPTPPWTWAATGLVAVAALLPGVLSYGAHSLLQRELGASRTAMMLYLAPVYGAALAWLLLGEVPGWYHAVGAAMILPSIWMASRR